MRFLPTTRELKLLLPEDVEALVPRLKALCPAHGVVLLYLHGSHARGEQAPMSDLDLAVLLEDGETRDFDRELALLASLQDASGREDVDLVFLNRAGPIIRDRVVRYGRLVYARTEKERILFEERAIKEALDFQYFSRQYDALLFRQLKEGRVLD